MENANADEGSNMMPDITVLYEDEEVLVMNKPAGLMVHNDGRYDGPTVAQWLVARAPKARGVGEAGFAQDGTPLERSGIVHRLDRETSGVLMLAKTQAAFLFLKEQFKAHHVRKEYRAFVYGTMKEKWGTIDRPIGRSAKDYRMRSAEAGSRGLRRPAITDWELIGQTSTHAYLKLRPKTGRTHQLRVHLKAISRPIVADTLYATPELLATNNLGFARLALHAYTLTIVLPSGEEKTFLAPFPRDFEEASTAIARG